MSARVKSLLITLLLAAICTSGCTTFSIKFPFFSDSPDETTPSSASTADTVQDSISADISADTVESTSESQSSAETEPIPETTDAISEESSAPVPEETVAIPIIIPSPIGQYADAFFPGDFPPEKIDYEFTHYSLPAGMIYDAVFSGTRTDTELIIDADSSLVLYVSTGIDFENVTVSEEDKTVYLTFDDGPSPKNTVTVLDILDEYGIKATFFLVGSSVESHPEIVQEIYIRGHKIGCHSFSHAYSDIYKNADSLLAEIEQWEAAIEAALGFIPAERLFRFPGGSLTCKDETIAEVLAAEGFRCFDWNAVNDDCFLHTRAADVTEEEFIKDAVTTSLAYSFHLKTSPHIMLMHDTYAETAEFLPWMIEYMTALGCSFGTLDELESGWLH